MNRITATLSLATCLCLIGQATANDKPLVVELWPGKVLDEVAQPLTSTSMTNVIPAYQGVATCRVAVTRAARFSIGPIAPGTLTVSRTSVKSAERLTGMSGKVRVRL